MSDLQRPRHTSTLPFLTVAIACNERLLRVQIAELPSPLDRAGKGRCPTPALVLRAHTLAVARSMGGCSGRFAALD